MGQVSSRASGKEENIKDIIKEHVWGAYPAAQINGSAPNQTERFFSSLPSANKDSFFSSKKKIVQFGVASGIFLQQDSFRHRDRIGYDYTQESASIVPFTHRLVDLNARDNDKLTYQPSLDEDLSVPCDILLVRLLEYLDDEAVTLLLTALIVTAKPGSTFYIEINKIPESSPLTNNLSIGKIGEFFKPKENFEVHVHSVSHELDDVAKYGLTEQLVVTKLK